MPGLDTIVEAGRTHLAKTDSGFLTQQDGEFSHDLSRHPCIALELAALVSLDFKIQHLNPNLGTPGAHQINDGNGLLRVSGNAETLGVFNKGCRFFNDCHHRRIIGRHEELSILGNP